MTYAQICRDMDNAELRKRLANKDKNVLKLNKSLAFLEAENAKLRKQLADKDKTLATVHERFDALQSYCSMLEEEKKAEKEKRESIIIGLSAPENVSFRFVPETDK